MGLSMDIPFRIDGAGRVASVTDPSRQVELRLRNLIATLPEERVMRSGFGAGAGSMVFEPNDELQAAALVSKLQDNIRAWEPNVVLDDLQVLSQDPAGGTVALEISYHRIDTGTVSSFTVTVGATATYGWPEGG